MWLEGFYECVPEWHTLEGQADRGWHNVAQAIGL